MGYTGFTLAMPFLPLYIRQLGVTDVGEVALWTGVSLGVTPGMTALLSPLWGRLGDRVGRKLMVERSLIAFVVLMTAMAYVTRAWHVLALRAVQGVFAGYGALSVAMAAESAPRDRMPNAIGLVQTAQRLGPAVGPVIGGILAATFGLRRAFLVTAFFYGVALVVVFLLYDERDRAITAEIGGHESTRIRFADVLAFRNFGLMMAVIFGVQFVDRSFGPILPLYVEHVGIPHDRVALVTGVLFSVMACAGALGHHFCGRLLKRYSIRVVVAGGGFAAAAGVALMAATGQPAVLALAALVTGGGVGAAMTASYTAAGSVIPPSVHGTAFGVLNSASLTGMAVSPAIAGFLGSASIRAAFVADVLVMGALAAFVYRSMVDVTLDDTATDGRHSELS